MLLSPSIQTLFVVLLALAVSLGGLFFQCNAASACASKNECTRVGLCSFKNRVALSTDIIYEGVQPNQSSNSDDTTYNANMQRFEELTRGVCAPGERLHLNLLTGLEECAPWRAWPDALNHEIHGEGPKNHQQMCGAWINAGSGLTLKTEYWSLHDVYYGQAATRASEATTFSSSRLASTDLGKLYASCLHTVIGGQGAIQESSSQAYSYLAQKIGNVSSRNEVLSAAGQLSGHWCEGPAQLGVSAYGSSFAAVMQRGTTFSNSVLEEALASVGASVELQTKAETANQAINEVLDADDPTHDDREIFFEAASQRLDHSDVQLLYYQTPELNGLLKLAEQNRFEEASAYLHGVAAFCSFSITAGMSPFDTSSTLTAMKQIESTRNSRPASSALGRLRKHASEPMELYATNISLLESTSMTFSSMPSNLRSTQNPMLGCISFTQWLFPDRLDNQYFQSLITNKMYSRVHSMFEELRTSVEHVVLNHKNISSILLNASKVATEVRETRIRVAGAPRGTWGGIQRDFTNPRLSSRDGPMLGALKQSRSMFLDRMNMLVDSPSACSGPPMFDSLEPNAYIYPGGRCTHILLGVLRKPFADERYDNTSLASRAGWIVAHELAHNTLISQTNSTKMEDLLHRYPQGTYSEAIADVIAALAVIHSGHATAKQICEHVSQLWCARTPLGYTTSEADTHPGPNERGDWMCETLADLGYSVQ